jgi:hypothetical protein
MFDSLTVSLQEKIFGLLVEKYQLQGNDAPAKRAMEKIMEQKPQSYEAWRRFHFFTMQAVDKALIKKGCSPKHFTTSRNAL